MIPALARVLLLAAALPSLPISRARAQSSADQDASATAPLRIGVMEDPPFATHRNGQWEGLSVDLWQAVGAHAGRKIEWVPVSDHEVTGQLAARRIDVGPAMAITAARVQTMAFTVPVVPSGVAIATMEDGHWDWRATLRGIWDSGLFKVALGIVGANLIVGWLLWRIERRRNPTSFGGGTGEGFGSGVWCSISTMTTVGYGDKVPTTWPGRLLCFMVMLSGVIVISLFTATATSTLTVAHLRPRVRTADDLRHAKSVAIEGSAGAQYLARRDLPRQLVPEAAAAIALLEQGTVSAFVHNRVELRAAFQKLPRHAIILPLNLEEDFYAFPVADNPAVRRQVDVALQTVLDSPAWDQIDAAYLGD